MIQEENLLEQALSLAEEGYEEAYRYLLGFAEENPACGPQTIYFLACLAGGSGKPEEALEWLKTSVAEKGFWYRPEVLIDDDLEAIREDPAFVSLKALSDERYAEAVSQSKAQLSWKEKTAENLFLAVHGNTQNAKTARENWLPILGENPAWQLETVQSAEPDGFGTYRWSYDETSFRPVAEAMERVQSEGYRKIFCGGFSAGCDMLLRAVLLSPARCDALILQSPWIPLLADREEDLMNALLRKKIALRILCGADDEDCLPLAQNLFAAANCAGVPAELTIQEKSRHQFPEPPPPLSKRSSTDPL